MIRSPLLTAGGSGNREGELTPPVIPGFTSLPDSEHRFIPNNGTGQEELMTNPLDLLTEASALFARAAKIDPTILRTMLELGQAIAKSMGGEMGPGGPELFGPRVPGPPPMMGPQPLPLPPPGMPMMPPGGGPPPIAL